MRAMGLLLVMAFMPGWGLAESLSDIGPLGEVRQVSTGHEFTEGPAWDGAGRLYFTDIPREQILVLLPDGKVQPFTAQSRHANGLMFTPQGRLLACEMDGQLVQWEIATQQRTVLAAEHDGRRFNAPNDLVLDSSGGVYFTDPHFRAPRPLPQTVQGVYYWAADGKLHSLNLDLPAPNGILLSPDEQTLYVLPSGSGTMLAYPVLSPGVVGQRQDFCRIAGPGGSDGAAMDTAGNLYLTTRLGVQVFSPQATHLGTIAVPEHPANCTFGGADRRTLYITARTSLYAVSMPLAGHVYGK